MANGIGSGSGSGNGDGNSVTWKWVVGIAGAALLLAATLFSSVTGWFMTQGLNTLQENDKRTTAEIQSICAEFRRNNMENKSTEAKLERRMDRMEVLITLPYEKRVELLRNLGGVRQNNGSE